MMKKTLFVFVVLALIAQICARPEDKEDDSENIAKETAKKAVKEGQDKAAEAGEKGQNEAKAHAGKPKEMFDNLKNKGKESAEALGKHGGNKVESNNPQHQVKMSAVVRKAEVAGEKLIETGTNIFAKMLENMGL